MRLKIKIPNRLAYKFLLPIAAVIMARAVVLDLQTQNAARSVLTSQASTQISQIVRLQAELKDITPADFMRPSPDKLAAQKFQAIYDQLHTKDVIRLKVWDRTGTVIYSDDARLIGKNFGPNPELQAAIASGDVKTEITQPGAAENVDERAFPAFMEIYTPVTFAGGAQSPGVIEVYYQLNGLEQSVNDFMGSTFFTLSLTFLTVALVLGAILYFTVLRPLKALTKATSRVAAGNLDTPVPARGSDEIAELGSGFNTMLHGLKELERLRNEFVFVAAHELRAPVSVIRGYLSMASNGETTKTNALHQITQANGRLEQLVNDLLDVARADAGKLKVATQPINLTDMVRKTAAFFVPLAAEKHMEIVYRPSQAHHMILADERRLKEVLTNLISNAVKYGEQSTPVDIYFDVKDGMVTTCVKNAGLGIAPTAQKHIFEKFYRSPEAEASAAVGTGLGLYITKELVERMGGTIGFTSEVGKGSTFYVTFKLVDGRHPTV